MNDPFLINSNAINRLIDDWRKHGSLIVAFDFDNTVFDYHQKGYEFPCVIALLRRCRKLGFKLICYTARDDLDNVAYYLRDWDIPFDAINEDIVGQGGSRKIYYNILLDDRAGLHSAYKNLKFVCGEIERDKSL